MVGTTEQRRQMNEGNEDTKEKGIREEVSKEVPEKNQDYPGLIPPEFENS